MSYNPYECYFSLSDMRLTAHYFKRAYQRFGCNRAQALELAREAYLYGKTVDRFSGWFRSYLERKRYSVDHLTTVILVYSGALFIFSDSGVLRTVYSADHVFIFTILYYIVFRIFYFVLFCA